MRISDWSSDVCSSDLLANPTYHRLGDHTESFQIDFDREIVSYAALLEILWKSHQPQFESYSRQYAAAVFYENESKKQQNGQESWRERVCQDVYILVRSGS